MLSPFRTASILGTETLSLTTSPTALPNIPDGVGQMTIRGTDNPWEWRFTQFGSSYFWMAAGDTLSMPIRDQAQLEDFQFKGATDTTDIRIIYES